MTRELLYIPGLPVLQNRTFGTVEHARASATGDMLLVQDESTGLVFNAAFSPELVRYDGDYQNEQACSEAFQRHLQSVADCIDRRLGGRRLLEVGCGKGYFLEQLRERGYDITGVDPAYEGQSPNVTKAPFDRSLGLTGEGIILRHVLEHVPDPFQFLSEIRDANEGSGVIYIEVPCFDWIVARRAWFDVFYEHVNYFRLADFARMFGYVHEQGHLFGGQYLYVFADLASLRPPRTVTADQLTLPDTFLEGINRAADLLRRGPGRCAIWGASSKGVIFSVHMHRAGAQLAGAVDINPRKQGRFLPVSGLQVVAANDVSSLIEPGDTLFVMNSNYLGEVIAQSGSRYDYRVVDRDQL